MTRRHSLRPGVLVLFFCVAASVFWTVACDRNTEDLVEGEKPRAPDLARIFPESEGGSPGGAPAMPGMQRGNVPPARAETPQRGAPPLAGPSGRVAQATGSSRETSGETISGTISVAPALAGSVASDAMLFVIARPFGVQAGPPMAVLRMPSPRFPVAFEIGPDNVMIPSMRFEGNIGISVRLDGDGNAMTRLPGDLSGATPAPLQPGARDVSIVLDQKL